VIPAEVVEAAVRATPGVKSLFRSSVTDVAISVSIGVDPAAQAPATAAAVAAAIRSLAPDALVSVRVSRVA
jgi:hypothetical protein